MQSPGATECLCFKRQQGEQPLVRREEPFQSRLHSSSSLEEVGDPLKYPRAWCGEEHIIFWLFSFHPDPIEATFQTGKWEKNGEEDADETQG